MTHKGDGKVSLFLYRLSLIYLTSSVTPTFCDGETLVMFPVEQACRLVKNYLPK